MGASGEGKTTLLNVLANKISTSVISGEKVVNAKYQDEGFAHKVDYVQQQDMSIPMMTVQEALLFSADQGFWGLSSNGTERRSRIVLFLINVTCIHKKPNKACQAGFIQPH